MMKIMWYFGELWAGIKHWVDHNKMNTLHRLRNFSLKKLGRYKKDAQGNGDIFIFITEIL